MAERRLGVWAELAGTLGGLLLATLLVAMIPVLLVVGQIDAERRSEVGLAISEVLTGVLDQAVSGAPDEEARDQALREVVGQLSADSVGADTLALLGADGRVIAALGPRADPPFGPVAARALADREQQVIRAGSAWRPGAVTVVTPLAWGDAAKVALCVQVSRQPLPLPGWSLSLALALPAGVAVPIVFFYYWVWIRRRLVRPILSLREGTRRIAQGEFGYQLSVEAARELGDLRDDLNALSTSLLDYRAQVEQQFTEIGRAQNALIRSEKLAVVGRLAAGLAHEVGNPLAAVLGFMELLGEGMAVPRLRDAALEQDLVARSRKELERISRILRELLDCSRAGPGVPEDVSLLPAIEDAVGTVRPQPAFRDVAVEIDVPPGLPPVRIERDKLIQVLLNLLLNAADALGDRVDGRGGAIHLRAALDQRQIELRCEDDGPGFLPEAIERVFEPFFTSKAVGKGTGLGLATCLQIVEAAGGSIGVENRPKGGAVVWFRLPIATALGGGRGLPPRPEA